MGDCGVFYDFADETASDGELFARYGGVAGCGRGVRVGDGARGN